MQHGVVASATWRGEFLNSAVCASMPAEEPQTYKTRMKSPRLHGVHQLTGGLLVEVNSLDHRQRVFQLQPHQDPILKGGT